jgi:hypothetical protein
MDFISRKPLLFLPFPHLSPYKYITPSLTTLGRGHILAAKVNHISDHISEVENRLPEKCLYPSRKMEVEVCPAFRTEEATEINTDPMDIF